MSDPIFKRHYEINSIFVNARKKLGLYALLNLLQDAAWTHANELGFGYEDSLRRKVFWVLTRQKVVMQEWPAWHESIEIHTWIRPILKSFTYRDFEIFHEDRKIGEATTSWVLLDADTRRPTTIDFENIDNIVRKEGALEIDAPKISLKPDLESRAEFQVRNSDLDVNEHVNNTKYAQWILDSIPREWHHEFELHSFEVNFLAETFSQDLISIQMEPEKKEPVQGEWIQFQGYRRADEKTVFAARLQVSTL
jgi:acyl-ACP thioesterase